MLILCTAHNGIQPDTSHVHEADSFCWLESSQELHVSTQIYMHLDDVPSTLNGPTVDVASPSS